MKTEKLAKTGLKIGKRGGKRNGAGKPPTPITKREREMVRKLSGFGISPVEIAALLRTGISTETLYKHFREDMILGRSETNLSVSQKILKKALAGDNAMLTLWAKTRMGWTEKQQVEVSGPDGGPIEFQKIERVIVDSATNFDASRGQETPEDEDE